LTVQAVHCSDLHLDRSFNIPDLQRAAARKEDLNRNLVEIVDFAIHNHADLFLVSGDVFDRVRPSNDTAVLLTRKVRELKDHGITTFAIAGNHDIPKIGNYRHIALDMLSSAGLAQVFSQSDTIQKQAVHLDGEKVCISGKSYDARNEAGNPLRGQKVPLEGDLNILLLHASLRGLGVTPSIPEMAAQNPFSPDDIKHGLNYLALGHYHNFYEREHNGVKICNPGSIERITWAEMNEAKGFAWISIDRENTALEFIPLRTREMRKHDLRLDSGQMANPIDFVAAQLERIADSELILRVSLSGQITVEEYQKLQMTELYRRMRGSFFHLIIDRVGLGIEGYGRVFLGRVDNPVEAFAKRIDLKIETAATVDERQRLAQIRELGIGYLGEAT
jgi:DNA repair exonuclease SbcCD nuclease subunit